MQQNTQDNQTTTRIVEFGGQSFTIPANAKELATRQPEEITERLLPEGEPLGGLGRFIVA